MSAPRLPEAFGNYALKDFAEILPPAGIDWLPQTPGWAVLGTLVLAWLLRRVYRALRRWHRNRYRREAAAALRTLQNQPPGQVQVADINQLLKRAALAGYAREQVAGLNGQCWIDFLNGECPAAVFTGAPADWLRDGPYRQQLLSGDQCRLLVAAASDWLAQHRGPATC